MSELQWGMLQTPDIVGSVQKGYAFGNQIKQQRQAEQDQNQLRALAPQIIAGDANAYGQAAAISPQAAQQYQGAGDAQLRRISGLVNYVKNAQKSGDPRAVEAAWQQARPYIAKTTGVEPPATFAEAAPHFGQLEARISMLGQQEQQRNLAVSPGSAIVDPATGQVIYERPFAPANGQIVKVPDGQGGMVDMVFDPKTRQLEMPQFPGQGQPPAPSPQMAPGEVPFSIDPSLPANVQADIRARQPLYAAASENGGEVPPQAQPGPTVGGFGYTPPKAAAPEKPSALQERLDIASSMGATPEQLNAIVMGSASTKGPSAAEQKDMLSRRAKVPQLQNAVRGLSRIEAALEALDTPGINTGPYDQYIMRDTPAGQELDAAVGGIQNSFLSLTRVPGIGSQSDLEARIANLQYPSIDKAPEVNRKTMANLKAFARDLAQAYESAMQQDASVRPAPADGPAAALGAIQRARNPQTGEIVELRNGAWVPVK